MITDYYIEQNRQLHAEKDAYGASGWKRAEDVTHLRREFACETVLDYGCGKSTLARAVQFPMAEYDPAIPGKEALPAPADFVVCSDVLEHIEPEHLDAVLDHIKGLTRKLAYFVIHTGPAIKTLPDGRNTHLTQEPWAWWEAKLLPRFKVQKAIEYGIELHVLVTPK